MSEVSTKQHILGEREDEVFQGIHAEDLDAFLQESIALFSKTRQGHLIHRMYMSEAALTYWSEFMQHDGYYVTRSEVALISQFAAAAGESARHPDGIIGIENGPGTDSALQNKSAVFFSAMPGLHTYVGRDWSPTIVSNVGKVLNERLAGVRIIADLANYRKQPLPAGLGKGRKVMAEFGATRGNMEGLVSDPFPSHVLMAGLRFHRSQLEPGDIYIVTFDSNQDKASVEYAYTSAWLTKWGCELFRTMRQELPIEGKFDPDGFEYVPIFHPGSYLTANNMVALKDMNFTISGREFAVSRGDAFAITNSYKTPVSLFSSIAASAGFEVAALYQDESRRMTMPVLIAV
ncbi:L-histidine N(alpha)-methyltransferase [Rhizobium rhizogenes]|uniref:L-histidine N(alpha)-methyltransferase n=1 Tax=Rhizobium rhizogenes TaxID=359 RepID=UPI001574EAB6|nr:L-histidine N(alpha)-methyltransferase [Rhizobium rhizogenes]NTG02967.1 L-histidine N(alpha)-methyltransferase [Rhizobium rhizogenes]NTG10030.1 L-histidine N(alpha)-methyltransferase [Rhizobium rhizogenes]